MIIKQVKQKKALAAAPDAGDDFYQSVFFPVDQLLQVMVSSDDWVHMAALHLLKT